MFFGGGEGGWRERGMKEVLWESKVVMGEVPKMQQTRERQRESFCSRLCGRPANCWLLLLLFMEVPFCCWAWKFTIKMTKPITKTFYPLWPPFHMKENIIWSCFCSCSKSHWLLNYFSKLELLPKSFFIPNVSNCFSYPFRDNLRINSFKTEWHTLFSMNLCAQVSSWAVCLMRLSHNERTQSCTNGMVPSFDYGEVFLDVFLTISTALFVSLVGPKLKLDTALSHVLDMCSRNCGERL